METMDTRSLRTRLGSVKIPESIDVIGLKDPDEFGLTPDPFGPINPIDPPRIPELENVFRPPWENNRLRPCNTTLQEGCYTLTFRPANTPWWGNMFVGTLRVESVGRGYRISGDLYRRGLLLSLPVQGIEHSFQRLQGASDEEADAGGVIPIYKRRQYSSYLKGTSASMFSVSFNNSPCTFTLNFDEFDYSHPATGFSGSFPTSAARTLRYVMNAVKTNGSYTGKAFSGSKELGSVSMRWVSSSFRRATLKMHKLQGSELPPQVGSEDMRSIFQTAGWDVSVSTDNTALPKPSSLSSQVATACWTSGNLHRFMQTVPGYDPAILDTDWQAHLVAVPATLGCSRGIMFDSSGDLNDVKREGAATFSHDGFPVSNSSNFGTAEDELMKDHPRAFLRSAAHEVGHTFNQIHQGFEGGSDNSIMTVTPSVADVIAGAGQSFPDDINLGFNETVRQHLIHQPDPAVRPGAMEFFGVAVATPQADQIAVVDEAVVTVKPNSQTVRLGEPLPLKWSLENTSDAPMVVPSSLCMQSLTARISVTGPRGDIRFVRPVDIEVCGHHKMQTLSKDETLSSGVTLYYGTEGFAFSEPGTHTIEVILLWQIAGASVMASGSAEVWVSYPVTAADNDIAAQLLHPCVGECVALGDSVLVPEAKSRIKAAMAIQAKHPACERIKKLGLSGTTSTRKKSSSKK